MPKEVIQKLKRYAKIAEELHKLHIELADYFIDEGLDVNFVIENLNSMESGDLTQKDLLKIFKDEWDYVKD